MKNISFMVSAEGVNIAPGYDLLSTAVYATKGFADERTTWPNSIVALPFPDTRTFSDVTRSAVLRAGRMLGLKEDTAKRELDRLVQRTVSAADELISMIEIENNQLPAEMRSVIAGERQVLRAIRHIIIAEMVGKLKP